MRPLVIVMMKKNDASLTRQSLTKWGFSDSSWRYFPPLFHLYSLPPILQTKSNQIKFPGWMKHLPHPPLENLSFVNGSSERFSPPRSSSIPVVLHKFDVRARKRFVRNYYYTLHLSIISVWYVGKTWKFRISTIRFGLSGLLMRGQVESTSESFSIVISPSLLVCVCVCLLKNKSSFCRIFAILIKRGFGGFAANERSSRKLWLRSSLNVLTR